MEIGYQTNVGRRRKNNQDALGVFYNLEKTPLVIIADGMGGHLAGDVASQMAVTILGEEWQTKTYTTKEEMLQWLLQVIQKANQVIYQASEENENYTGMGTTIVCGILFEQSLLLAHVGDSRCYLVNKGKLHLLTEDHSLVNVLLKSGEITQAMADHHPQKNVLLRSIGSQEPVEIDITEIHLEAGDQLLLCSDGLTNMVAEPDILAILQEPGAMADVLDHLIQMANAAGGSDNISVLRVTHPEEALPEEENL